MNTLESARIVFRYTCRKLTLVCWALVLATGAVCASDLEDGRAAIGAGRYQEALRLLQPLAERGDAVAQNALGFLHLQGWGVPQNPQTAFNWFRRAAEHGDPRAQYNLARLYHDGQGVPRNLKEAERWYRLAAQQGHAPAQTLLGSMYALGEGVPLSYADAMTWYRKAADQGDPEAQRRVGLMYAEGQGVERDYGEARQWYLRSAEQGNSVSMHALGLFYEQGKGVKSDSAEASRWFRRAAEQGYPPAVRRLQQGASSQSGATLPVPTLNQALGASSAALGSAYLLTGYMLKLLQNNVGGARIVTADEVVDGANVAAFVQAYESRRAVYDQAIRRRGFGRFAGPYVLQASTQCRRAESDWLRGIAEGVIVNADIVQDEFRFDIESRVAEKGETIAIKQSGIIVGPTLYIRDAWNPDFLIQGALNRDDGRVTLRPDVEAMSRNSRPDWLPSVNWKELSQCTATLTRR